MSGTPEQRGTLVVPRQDDPHAAFPDIRSQRGGGPGESGGASKWRTGQFQGLPGIQAAGGEGLRQL